MTKQNPEYHKAWYEKNRTRRLKQASDWYARVMSDPVERRRFKDIKNAYRQERLRNDPDFHLRVRLKQKLRYLLVRDRVADQLSIWLVGCDQSYLKRWLKLKFQPDMTWDNYGVNGWVVDHIIPCCRFVLTDDWQRVECFHYTNLQPLWYEDNRQKSIT